jgi:hypothetical protein
MRAGGSSASGLLLDRLVDARRRDFVGRSEELGLFESVLGSSGGGVVFVHGPGGLGKTSLLHQYAWLGERHGRRVIRFDAAETGPSAGAVLAGLIRAAGLPGSDAPAGPAEPPAVALAALAEVPRILLLIDGAEHLATLDQWLREELLARMPADAVVVLAGRQPPSLGWRADPGWHDLLRVVTLRPLDPESSREVLRRRGVPESAATAAVAFARGHPLALALAAEIGPDLAGRPVPGAGGPPGAPPEALKDLLAGLLDVVPGPLHRAALEASAQVLVTTEALLSALLDQPAHEVFGWLSRLSVMEYTDRGVRPHELVRDLLAADLRWRDPDQRALLHRRAGAYYAARLRAGDPVLVDFAYLHRDSDVLGPFLSHVTGARGPDDLAVTPMAEGEWPTLREWLVRYEGGESARLVDAWASPATVRVVRGADGTAHGFLVLLALESLDPATREADPATAAAWRHAHATGPPDPGETALFVRAWLTPDAYQDLSPAQLAMTLHLVRLYLTVPGLALSYFPVADPEAWAGPCGYAELIRTPEADFTVDGRAYGVYAHDWRAMPPAAWLQRLADRENAGAGVAEPAAAVGVAGVGVTGVGVAGAGVGAAGVGVAGVAARVGVFASVGDEPPLTEERFAAAVRGALRELGRTDRLADNLLAGTAAVGSAGSVGPAGSVGSAGSVAPAGSVGPERGRAVERAIRTAAAELERSPRDRRGYRALHHTYLQPAGTQEKAAELLNLPMTTYRRHLTEGVARLTELLWHHELAARTAARTAAPPA